MLRNSQHLENAADIHNSMPKARQDRSASPMPALLQPGPPPALLQPGPLTCSTWTRRPGPRHHPGPPPCPPARRPPPPARPWSRPCGHRRSTSSNIPCAPRTSCPGCVGPLWGRQAVRRSGGQAGRQAGRQAVGQAGRHVQAALDLCGAVRQAGGRLAGWP